MNKLFAFSCLVALLILLSSCSAYEEVVYDAVDDSICQLKATLLRHEYIITVYPVDLSTDQVNIINSVAEEGNLPYREFVIYRIR